MVRPACACHYAGSCASPAAMYCQPPQLPLVRAAVRGWKSLSGASPLPCPAARPVSCPPLSHPTTHPTHPPACSTCEARRSTPPSASKTPSCKSTLGGRPSSTRRRRAMGGWPPRRARPPPRGRKRRRGAAAAAASLWQSSWSRPGTQQGGDSLGKWADGRRVALRLLPLALPACLPACSTSLPARQRACAPHTASPTFELHCTNFPVPSCCRRDLAEQTHNNITLFRKHLRDPSIRNELLVGGTAAAAQLRALKEGVDIVVGTPGAGPLACRACWEGRQPLTCLLRASVICCLWLARQAGPCTCWFCTPPWMCCWFCTAHTSLYHQSGSSRRPGPSENCIRCLFAVCSRSTLQLLFTCRRLMCRSSDGFYGDRQAAHRPGPILRAG